MGVDLRRHRGAGVHRCAISGQAVRDLGAAALGAERATADDPLAQSPAGVVVGFISGGAIREPHPGFDAELHAIYLLLEAQGQGIGTRLVRAWAGRAAASGLRAAVVRVLSENSARGFYDYLGARRLKDGEVAIGSQSYKEVWYGWDDLSTLAV